MTQIIYWLYHWYDDDERNLKTIGFFSDQDKAQAALDQVKSKPGFKDYPDGFETDVAEIDRIEWTDGFGID